MSMAEYVATMAAEIAAAGDPDELAGYTLGAPADQSYAGLERYWSKREAAR
jgi:hypothetical protein